MKLLLFLSLKKVKNGWNNFSHTFSKFLLLLKVPSKYVIPNERLLTVVPICIHPMTNDVESSASLLRSFRCCLYVLDSHPLLDRLVCIYFLPVFSLYFHPFNRVFSEHKVFCFCFFPLIKFSLSICPSKNHAFAVKSRLPSGLHGRCRGETHWASSTDESPGSVLGSSYSSRPEC